ncbi:hypothetical protein GCM10009630_27270 [Kribbella jejuensis]|uniref:DUF5709 domain-containing protein n=1 Tax=Kribbella jejuensis TaxID=236068 RepID=A0A542EPI0_9ACTN|nr:hypothetical protein [Kribbella jejuensis]TQJ17233.1 hypothetical protein FB475_1347 [Kribbella jejuensis]
MTSETDYEGPGDFENLPDDAPEADVLEQRQASTVVDDRSDAEPLPAEADPADVEEQRRGLDGTDDEDGYR